MRAEGEIPRFGVRISQFEVRFSRFVVRGPSGFEVRFSRFEVRNLSKFEKQGIDAGLEVEIGKLVEVGVGVGFSKGDINQSIKERCHYSKLE